MECLKYIYNDLFCRLEEVMIGVSKALEEPKPPGAKVGGGNVAEELKTFGKECK